MQPDGGNRLMTAWLTSLSFQSLQTLNSCLLLGAAISGTLTGAFGLASWEVGKHITARQQSENVDIQIQLEHNRVTVNQHLQNRNVLDSQGKILAASLAPLRGKRVAISVIPHNQEAEQFADKIRTAMTTSGLDVSRAGQVPAWPQTPDLGLVVGSARQDDAAVLSEALRKSGLVSGHIQRKPTGETMGLELFIGPKP
jgi:hypothetical protein